ncbi:hypothetical protein D3C81_441840 [compost metagenome]
MIPPFEWEDRYVVFKRKDLGLLPPAELAHYELIFMELNNRLSLCGAPGRQMIVIEGDWPEYQPTCEALQARVLSESEANFLSGVRK